jgi:hypothetical protein
MCGEQRKRVPVEFHCIEIEWARCDSHVKVRRMRGPICSLPRLAG